MFGSIVNLNFNRKGNTHQTTIGGILSILINTFIFGYSVYQFYLLFTFGNDNIIQADQETDFGSIGQKSLESLRFSPII